MVFSASTLALTGEHESVPRPFSQTAGGLGPTTTDAPGYPPALIPRWTTRSMASRREEDIPTASGALTGRPSLPCTSVRTVTMTLSTSALLPACRYAMRQAEFHQEPGESPRNRAQ